MTKIFAGNSVQQIDKKELYIKNYAKNKEKEYRELFPFLQQERQARLIEGKEFRPEKVNPQKHIVVVLGDPLEEDKYLNFQIKEKTDVFEQFQNFAKKELVPALLDNLEIEFGGNIFDVRTKQNRVTKNSPAIFIGKFTEEIPTRMKITGNTLKSKFEMESALDLSNKEFTKNELSEYLPELWNNLGNKKIQNPAKKISFGEKINLGKILFYILILGIILLLITLIRYVFRDKEDEYSFPHEEEVPIFHSEISEKEYQEYEKKIDETDHGIPFEVIWKQDINK
jgi:hypothetical protein